MHNAPHALLAAIAPHSHGQFASGKLGHMSTRRSFIIAVAAIALAIVGIALGIGWRLLQGDGSLLRRVSLSEAVISPNADGQTDVTTISYDLARNARVSISFTDSDGKIHYFRRDQQRGAGEYEVNFSGVVEGYLLPGEEYESEVLERLLQDGTYTWSVSATESSGNVETASGEFTVTDADTALPEIRNFTLDRERFTPNQDGISDRVQIDFFLPKQANVEVFLVLEDGSRLPISERPTERPPGEAGRHVFDYAGGIDEGSGPPPDGTYPVVAISEDLEGQKMRVDSELTIALGGVPYAHILSPVTGDTVEYSTTAVELCDTVFFTLTVENYGETPIRTSGPPPGTIYDSNWNYNTVGYPTESGAWRIGIGYENALSDYPYRWGLGKREDLTEIDGYYYLMPGQRAVITGGIRVVDRFGVRNPQPMWAGLIHEDVEISLFNNRVDPKQILVELPDEEHMPTCEERTPPESQNALH